MKKKGTKAMSMAIALLMLAMGAGAVVTQQSAMTKQSDGTYIVNTTTLCQNVKGYRGTTPLKIYIKNDKVEKIEALKNQETPKYFARVKEQMLNMWNGKTVKKATKLKVNGVTGATMSSDAVKKNVTKGLEYYQAHK